MSPPFRGLDNRAVTSTDDVGDVALEKCIENQAVVDRAYFFRRTDRKRYHPEPLLLVAFRNTNACDAEPKNHDIVRRFARDVLGKTP
jgi:hypothetical protein